MKLAWRRHTEAPTLEPVPIDPRQRRVLASLPAWRTERDHKRFATQSRAYTVAELTAILMADPYAELVTREGEGPTIIEHLHRLASMGLVTATEYPGRWSMTELGLFSLMYAPAWEGPTMEVANGRAV